MMEYRFSLEVTAEQRDSAFLISGPSSLTKGRQVYVLESFEDKDQRTFEIRYDHHCSPFKEIRRVLDHLFVGHEQHLYVFNLMHERPMQVLEMWGYFGHLYEHENLVYATGMSELICLSIDGEIRWSRKDLGIDGVIIERFEDDILWGAGEWDPPDGWREFRLDRLSGEGLTWG